MTDSIPCITELHKEFYKKYICSRYELVIRPAFDLITAEERLGQTMTI